MLIPGGMGTVRFITEFLDHADPIIPYMYHCHMLTHEDGGMMGQFLVTDQSGIIENGIKGFEVYPNPSVDGEVNVMLDGYEGEVVVSDLTGRNIVSLYCAGQDVLKLNLEKGMYYIHNNVGSSTPIVIQ